VNPEGKVISTYQKTFLYETDENWAIEGPGFVSFQVHELGSKVRSKLVNFCMIIPTHFLNR
jgi:predicted amidohydrolase